MKFVEEEGKTVDEAVEKALKKLGVSKEEVQIEVVEESESKGLFGFGTTKSVKVKVILSQNDEKTDLKSVSKKILTKIIELMDVKAEIVAKETNDSITLEIKTENAALLIGKRGQTINALQEIVALLLDKSGIGIKKRIVLDTEDYRRRRAEVLISLARKSAKDAIERKKEIELEPMIPQERYIIHSTLQNYPNVTTQSRGEGIDRRVVILPK